MLVDEIDHAGDELLQKDARRDADAAAEGLGGLGLPGLGRLELGADAACARGGWHRLAARHRTANKVTGVLQPAIFPVLLSSVLPAV